MQRSIEVLLEDEAFLVINKPAGLASVHDGMRPGESDVVTMLKERLGAIIPVHRLDLETSGVMLLSRNPAAHAALSQQFESREVEKTYHAIVVGTVRWDERTIDSPLLPNGDRRHRTIVDPVDGKPSLTIAKVIERVRGFALVEAHPKTGRTHQIRAHLASVGAHIACDALYGDGKPVFLSEHKKGYRPTHGEKERPLLGRLGLHALRITFQHPTTRESVTVETPLPKDMAATLKQIGKL